jgi:hypothetical protein
MKSLRLTTVTSIAVFCLLALQVRLKAQEWQKHSFAELINESDEIEGFSETSTPNPLVATTVRLSLTHLSFGSVKIKTNSSPQTVTLANLGTSSLTIFGISIIGTDPKDFFQTHTCGSHLARGASCSIKVTFRPTVAGRRTAALSIRDNGIYGNLGRIVPLVGGPPPSQQCISHGRQCDTQHWCCPGSTCVLMGGSVRAGYQCR